MSDYEFNSIPAGAIGRYSLLKMLTMVPEDLLTACIWIGMKGSPRKPMRKDATAHTISITLHR